MTSPAWRPVPAKQLRAFAAMMAEHRAMVADGVSADQILASILNDAGYLDELTAPRTPRTRPGWRTSIEFVSVAGEFVARRTPKTSGRPPVSCPSARGNSPTRPTAAWLASGLPEPDDSLAAFLERIALVADSDQIPGRRRR
jgi:DNA helicase-2/ATP-dependent DNA helicase PcrA